MDRIQNVCVIRELIITCVDAIPACTNRKWALVCSSNWLVLLSERPSTTKLMLRLYQMPISGFDVILKIDAKDQ